MKSKLLLTLLLIANINCILAQKYKTFKKYYDNGQLSVIGEKVSRNKIFEPVDESDWLKNGEWKYYYPDGTLLMKGYFNRNEKIDEWVAYYPNGKKFLKGKYQQYFTNGADLLFDNDNRYVRSVEEWISYWDDGTIANIYTFKDDGTIISRVINTQFEDNYTYSNGNYGKGEKAISISYSWNWQDQPFIEIENSILEMGSFYRYGKWIEYNKNGWKLGEGLYDWKTNKAYGKWVIYYQDGKIKSLENYKSGKLDGLKTKFYNNGVKAAEINYVNGELFGEGIFWNEEGTLTKRENYIDDNTADAKFFYPNGIIQSHGMFIYSNNDKKWLKNGEWKFYYESGKLSNISHYEKGKLDGKVNHYWENGNKLQDEVYQNGSRNGITTWYYNNGQIKESALYKYNPNEELGFRIEILSSFNKDGTPREKGTLKNGNGTWIIYDENGNKTGVTVFKNGMKVE